MSPLLENFNKNYYYYFILFLILYTKRLTSKLMIKNHS